MARGIMPLKRSVLIGLIFLSAFVLSTPSTSAVSTILEYSRSDADYLAREKFVETGKDAYFEVTYRADNTIRGRVLNLDGVAMNGVCVTLLPAQGNGFRRKRFTDERKL